MVLISIELYFITLFRRKKRFMLTGLALSFHLISYRHFSRCAAAEMRDYAISMGAGFPALMADGTAAYAARLLWASPSTIGSSIGNTAIYKY